MTVVVQSQTRREEVANPINGPNGPVAGYWLTIDSNGFEHQYGEYE